MENIRKIKSFTLVEIMIVVGVILLLASIAIPNLLRARFTSQESVAMGALRALVTAQTSYRATHSRFASLDELYAENPPYIDSILASGNKQGFTFAVGEALASRFYLTAAPQVSPQGHSFYVDEDGVMCRSDATGASLPNAHVASGCPGSFSEIQ
jgi:type II secretory pathway pseudopilin PulG